MKAKTILLLEDNQDDVTLTVRDHKKSNLPTEIVVARDGVESYKPGAKSYFRNPLDYSQFSETVHQLGLCCPVLNESP